MAKDNRLGGQIQGQLIKDTLMAVITAASQHVHSPQDESAGASCTVGTCWRLPSGWRAR